MVDLLERLADRGRSVFVTLTAGRKLAGSVSAVGDDFMILFDSLVGDVIVPFRSLAAVLPGSAAAHATQPAPTQLGDGWPLQTLGTQHLERPLSLFVCFGDAMVDLASERARILAEVAGESLRGELRAAGQDVVTLRLDTPERRHLHIRTDAIDCVALCGR